MPRPNTTAEFGPDAQQQLADAVEAGVLAAQTPPTPVAFQTGEIAIPKQATTNPPSTPTPSGVLLRVEGDCYVNSQTGPTGGMIVYEGDDLKFENITDLDQIHVTPIKNKDTVLRWATL